MKDGEKEAITAVRPYTIKIDYKQTCELMSDKIVCHNKYRYNVYYRDSFICTGIGDKNEQKSLLALLNDAYQKGFNDCSIQLLKKRSPHEKRKAAKG